MKNYIYASLLFLLGWSPLPSFSETFWILPIVRVIDGDTIESRIDSLPSELSKVYVRIRGVDTPESRKGQAKCEEELKKGKTAKFALKDFVDNEKEMRVSFISWDKYGGRIDARVEIKNTDIAQWLIDNRYARVYTGAKKSNWCEESDNGISH